MAGEIGVRQRWNARRDGQIRTLRRSGLSVTELARIYNVSHQRISQICRDVTPEMDVSEAVEEIATVLAR